MTLGPDRWSAPSNADESSPQRVHEQENSRADEHVGGAQLSFSGGNRPAVSSTRHAKMITGGPNDQFTVDDDEERSVAHVERSPRSLKYRSAIGLADRILTSWGNTLRAVLVLVAIAAVLAAIAVVLSLLGVGLQFGSPHLYGSHGRSPASKGEASRSE